MRIKSDNDMTRRQQRDKTVLATQQVGSGSPDGPWERALEEVELRIKSAYPDFEICIVSIPHPSDSTKTIPVLCYDSGNGGRLHPFDFSSLFSDHEMASLAPRILCRIDKFPKRNNMILRKELQKKVMKTMRIEEPLNTSNHE